MAFPDLSQSIFQWGSVPTSASHACPKPDLTTTPMDLDFVFPTMLGIDYIYSSTCILPGLELP
jgi:hypothetical protein